MKLQRTFSCMTGALLAFGFASSQANAGVELGCAGGAEIEINALRGGSPTVVSNGTKNITAKARIAKGTALEGQLLQVRLTIVASSASGGSAPPQTWAQILTLSEGKGGTGAKLAMMVPSCQAGEPVEFVATFTGVKNPETCSSSRRITKTCN